MKSIHLVRLKFIDLISGLKINDVLQSLREQQYQPKEELDKNRYDKADKFFSTAQQSAHYYTSFKNYEELPPLSKKTVDRNPADFFSTSYRGKIIKKSTSGSTGTPFVYYNSVQAQSYLWAGLLLSWESTGYQFGEKVAFIAGSALVKKSFKHNLFYKLMNVETYPVAILTEEIIAKHLQKIKDRKTRLIYGYPTIITMMADYIIKKGIVPPDCLHGIVCTSEMLSEQTRDNIEKAFGVKVFNQYGCNEAGISAFECEKHQLHLISSRCLYETDNEGNLIGTDLANEAFILMKYKTGDIVEFSSTPCNCGRSYPVIKKIVGRADDIITDRQNRKIHCVYFNVLFKGEKSISQYQVFFDEESISINLTVDKDFSEKKRALLLNSIKKSLDFESYEIMTNQEFYSSKNLKHSFIIDKRKHSVKYG